MLLIIYKGHTTYLSFREHFSNVASL